MTIAYFDCFSGISGDMALGALLDAGGELSVLEGAVAALGLDAEVKVSARQEERGHLGGTRAVVEVEEGEPRTVPQLLAVVERAALPAPVRARALDAIRRLGVAESRIHGRPMDDLHLHELGGADTLVDLVGSFWLLDSLGVETVYASPLPAPHGLAGEMPLPPPAAMRILEGSQAVLQPDPRTVELVTPTGAALLAAVAKFERPAMRMDRIGYGLGGRPDPGNALAVWLGEPVSEAPRVAVLETNLDDMSPVLIAALMEDLMAAGALDVSVTPILMKKGRPGHALAIITDLERQAALAGALLERSTSLGLRISHVERLVSGRRVIEVMTRWGEARVKVKETGGRVIDVTAEYEDCRRLAREAGADVRVVARAAEAAARKELGIE
ncbi:MAG: nickel pincer cofactor biosynthesis protein LarC [Chloroflexota bacterium]